MAKVICECGYIISDSTDQMRQKAKFVADQDFFDFLDTVEKEKDEKGTRSSSGYLGDIFQCPDCGNIMICCADNSRRCDFRPVDKEHSKDITLSYLGERWKGHLFGHYYGASYSLEYKRNKGELYWNTNKESGYICDMTIEDLKKRYYEKYEELKVLDILRGGFLRIDGKDEHSF